MSCSERRWKSDRQLPRAFVPEAVVASAWGGGWMFGWQGGPTLEDREAIIASIPPTGAATLHAVGRGWIRCGDARAGAVFAVQATPGPRFSLLRGTRQGWESLGEIPAKSVTQLLVVSSGEVWMLGADTLLRWRGGVFERHAAPGELDPTRDRLFFAAGLVVLSTPDGLYLARDGGRRWGHRSTGGAHIRAICAPYVAALRGGRIWSGRLSGPFVDWIFELADPGDPCGLGVDAAGVQLAVVPADPESHPGIALIHDSTATTYHTTLLRVPPTPAWIGLRGGRGVLALTAGRRVLEATT